MMRKDSERNIEEMDERDNETQEKRQGERERRINRGERWRENGNEEIERRRIGGQTEGGGHREERWREHDMNFNII